MPILDETLVTLITSSSEPHSHASPNRHEELCRLSLTLLVEDILKNIHMVEWMEPKQLFYVIVRGL